MAYQTHVLIPISIPITLPMGIRTWAWGFQHEPTPELIPASIAIIRRFEPTDTSGGTCDDGEECIGGYPRTVYTVRKLLQEQADLNPIYINAGDSFQGTLWYNIGRWNVTQQLLNILPAEAMVCGIQ